MNKRVEELVEWVAEKLYVWHCKSQNIAPVPFAHQNTIVKDWWLMSAKQILSHPDLALIDREKKLPFADWVTCRIEEIAKHTQQNMLKAGYLPIIPLAEAIKEIKQ